MEHEGYTRLPHREGDNCFACSQRNQYGLRMQFFTNGEKVVSKLRVPVHLSGWDTIVHGGIVTTMLDEVMGWAVMHLLKSMALTKSISVEFLKPVYVEDDLRVEAKLSKMRNKHEAAMESVLYNKDGELCARGSGVFALISQEVLKRRGLVNETVLESIARMTK